MARPRPISRARCWTPPTRPGSRRRRPRSVPGWRFSRAANRMSHASASSLPAPQPPRIFAIDTTGSSLSLCHSMPSDASYDRRLGRLGGVLRDLGQVNVRDEIVRVALSSTATLLSAPIPARRTGSPGRAPVPVRSGSSAGVNHYAEHTFVAGRPAACGTPGPSRLPLQLMLCPARVRPARPPGESGGRAATGCCYPAAQKAQWCRVAKSVSSCGWGGTSDSIGVLFALMAGRDGHGVAGLHGGCEVRPGGAHARPRGPARRR